MICNVRSKGDKKKNIIKDMPALHMQNQFLLNRTLFNMVHWDDELFSPTLN